MLIGKNISLRFKNESLLNSGNIILQQQIYGLVAPNGSGKTTLLRTLSGIYQASKVSIYLENEKGEQLSPLQQKKQLFYFETSDWFDGNLSAKDYLTFVSKEWNGNSQLIKEAIEFWQLDSFYKKPIKKYSLGMKQKTLLALYYVSNTNYWLLDEPTIGLDLSSQDLFIKFMKMAKKRGTTILFSSHQNDSMLAIADSFYILENQELKESKVIFS